MGGTQTACPLAPSDFAICSRRSARCVNSMIMAAPFFSFSRTVKNKHRYAMTPAERPSSRECSLCAIHESDIHHDPLQNSSSLSSSSTVANHDISTTHRAVRIVESKMPSVSLRTLLVHNKAFLCVLPERSSEFTEIFGITDIAGRHNDFSHQISSYIPSTCPKPSAACIDSLTEMRVSSAPAPLLTPCYSM